MFKLGITALAAVCLAITGWADELPTLAEATEASQKTGRAIFAMAGRDT